MGVIHGPLVHYWCFLVFLSMSSTYPKCLSMSSDLPLSLYYNLRKVLLIIICTSHLNGRELKNLGKPTVVCVIRMSHG